MNHTSQANSVDCGEADRTPVPDRFDAAPKPTATSARAVCRLPIRPDVLPELGLAAETVQQPRGGLGGRLSGRGAGL